MNTINNIDSTDDNAMLAAQDWTFPVPIAYGPGRLAEIGVQCVALGVSNPLIVTDRGSRDLPFIKQLQHYLSKATISSNLFYDISPNPRDDEISSGRAIFRANNHDAIIAIGGGSAMDGGKSIALIANNDINLWAFEFEQPIPEISDKQYFPVLITIPTTAGTGAETESTAMVIDTEKGMKFCIWHPQCKPSLVILDPELTIGLSKNMTAWTGADALTHAIEAYLVPGFHPLCDGLALESIAIISKYLAIAVNEPNNMTARSAMLVASCLAGVSFTKGLGLVHAISHMVGAEFNTQHGLTNAIVLPVVMRFNLTGMEEKVKRMAEAMGLKNHSIETFIGEIERILDEIDIPKSLGEIGVPVDCAKRIAEKAVQDSAATTNPRQASVDEIRVLTETAITKAR